MSEKSRIGIELAAVVGALCAVILLMRSPSLYFESWQSATFIGVPLAVAIILNLPISELGLAVRRPLRDLKFFGLACLIFLPPFAVGFYLFEHFSSGAGMKLRFPPNPGRNIAFEFLYLSLTEEFLFRGYMQKRLSRITGRVFRVLGFELPLAGIICAALFAGAHILYEAQVYRIFVFFPALVFAWLRYKSDSILAPTLFHGTCNLVAGWMICMFVYPAYGGS